MESSGQEQYNMWRSKHDGSSKGRRGFPLKHGEGEGHIQRAIPPEESGTKSWTKERADFLEPFRCGGRFGMVRFSPAESVWQGARRGQVP